MLGLLGDISSMGKLLNRNRGNSDDVEFLPSQSRVKLAKHVSSNKVDDWSQIEFSTVEEKITSFVEYLHSNPEN